MQSYLASFMIAVLVLMAGCGGDRMAELEGQVGRLQAQLDDAHAKLKQQKDVRAALGEAKAEIGALKGAVDNLKSTVLVSGYISRRMAVLGLQSAANEVENATIELESTIDEAISATR